MSTSSAASRIQANLKELFTANLVPGDAYIRFQLTSDITALLSIEQVQESLVVEAEKITSLPNMPESVIGIMSSREHVFCVFDLAQLLMLPSQLIFPREYQIIVLKTNFEESLYIGLAVTGIHKIMRLTTEQIQQGFKNFPSQIVTYTCGAVKQKETMIPLLDFNRILKTLNMISLGAAQQM